MVSVDICDIWSPLLQLVLRSVLLQDSLDLLLFINQHCEERSLCTRQPQKIYGHLSRSPSSSFFLTNITNSKFQQRFTEESSCGFYLWWSLGEVLHRRVCCNN